LNRVENRLTRLNWSRAGNFEPGKETEKAEEEEEEEEAEE